MDAREAIQKLKNIRFRYSTYQITEEQAYEEAKEPLKAYNDKATEIAKKYGVKPKLLPNKIIFW